jgi:hypothetical protein
VRANHQAKGAPINSSNSVVKAASRKLKAKAGHALAMNSGLNNSHISPGLKNDSQQRA